ncbi:hypothetical protein RRG08_050091 [Elysia crispata]|uniref:Uncharacterized protein n=1 Tax=Elysia crispata TaxID=231223 RepID=A0AAE0YUF6_9GAST|nr:hypothetical protein RRG08_050091 [Elysia crispata]
MTAAAYVTTFSHKTGITVQHAVTTVTPTRIVWYSTVDTAPVCTISTGEVYLVDIRVKVSVLPAVKTSRGFILAALRRNFSHVGQRNMTVTYGSQEAFPHTVFLDEDHRSYKETLIVFE